jgi:hypothetical protein
VKAPNNDAAQAAFPGGNAMKSTIRTIALATFVSIASLCPALHAQTTPLGRFSVPFSFNCGNSHLSAGVYDVTVDDGGVLVLRSDNYAIMTLARLSFDPASSKVNTAIFKKYGDRYFLEQIATLDNLDADIGVSKSEKQAAREWASLGQKGTQVALVSLPTRPHAGN